MADERLDAQVSSVTRLTSDSAWRALRGGRDGALFTADWIQALAMEGRVFCANAGSATTPITFGAGSIDTTEPDFALNVPAGTTVIPIEIRVKMETYGTTLLFETMAAVGSGGTLGTDADITITSLRTDAPITTTCNAGAASAADAVYMTTNVSEFWRDGLGLAVTVAAADDDSTNQLETFIWNINTAAAPPVLVGAAQLMVFASAQAGTGFITCIYAEVPSTSIV